MPELCRFYNIVIKMIFNDNEKHHKPHVHVYYNEYEASVTFDGEVIAGSLPFKQLKLVAAWRQFMKTSCTPRGTMQSVVFRLVKSSP